MKQLLSFLTGCLLATSALAASLIPTQPDSFKQCQQALPHAAQTQPGKNTLTRDEQAKLAAHLDILAEQAGTPNADSTAPRAKPDKSGSYTAYQPRQAGDQG